MRASGIEATRRAQKSLRLSPPFPPTTITPTSALPFLPTRDRGQILHRQAVPPPDKEAYPDSPGREEKAEERKEEGARRSSTPGTRRLSLHPKQERPKDEEGDIEIPIGVEVLCCAFSGDGEFFAVGASDGVVRVYNDSTRVRTNNYTPQGLVDRRESDEIP